MNEPVKTLLLFLNESDVLGDTPLYEVVVHRLRELGVAGASAHAGLMGFGRHHVVHEAGLFGMAADRPVLVVAVDAEHVIRRVIPDMRRLVKEGLLLVVSAELVGQ